MAEEYFKIEVRFADSLDWKRMKVKDVWYYADGYIKILENEIVGFLGFDYIYGEELDEYICLIIFTSDCGPIELNIDKKNWKLNHIIMDEEYVVDFRIEKNTLCSEKEINEQIIKAYKFEYANYSPPQP